MTLTLVDCRYEIIRPLGGGGFGDVYLAVQHGFDRQVALKLLRQEGVDEETSKRFHREAKLLSVLNHPNIALFIGHGIWEDKQYTALEFIPGVTLQQRIQQGKMDGAELKSLAAGLLAGLSHAHKAGIIHRDLKPANIIIQETTKTPKLIDFGLASTTLDHQKLTQEGCAIGSVLYMAPEQCTGQPVTFSVDLYALGCILHECITGQPPFASDVAVAVMFKHINEQPPIIDTKSDAERMFVDWLDRLMAKDPAERFGSADEASAALQALSLTGSDFGDVRMSQSKPIEVTAGKRSTSLLIATACLTALVVASAIWFMTREREADSHGFGAPIARESELAPRLDLVRQKIRQSGEHVSEETKVDVEGELEALDGFKGSNGQPLHHPAVLAEVVVLPWHATQFRMRSVERWVQMPVNKADATAFVSVDLRGIKALTPPISVTDREAAVVLYSHAIGCYRLTSKVQNAYRLANEFLNFAKRTGCSTGAILRAEGDLVETAWESQAGTAKDRLPAELHFARELQSKPLHDEEDANMLSQVSRILCSEGNDQEALKCVNVALSIDQESPNFDRVLAQAEKSQYEAELGMFKEATADAAIAEKELKARNPHGSARGDVLTRLYATYTFASKRADAARIARSALEDQSLSAATHNVKTVNVQAAKHLLKDCSVER